MIVREQRWIALGLMTVFLVLYCASLVLPSMVLYSVANSRVMSSESEVAAELEQGSYCRRLGGERLQLRFDHAVVTASGTRMSGLPTGTIACTSKFVRTGLEVLLEGWLGPLIGIFAWYANLLALVSITLTVIGRTPKIALAFAFGTVLLGLDAFRFAEEPSTGMTPGSFLDHFGSGYYVWEVSLVTLLLSQLVAVLPAKRLKARSYVP